MTGNNLKQTEVHGELSELELDGVAGGSIRGTLSILWNNLTCNNSITDVYEGATNTTTTTVDRSATVKVSTHVGLPT